MARPIINKETCKGCGLCIAACPKKILVFSKAMNHKGYATAQCTDESACIGCAFCGRMCPDAAITVEK